MTNNNKIDEKHNIHSFIIIIINIYHDNGNNHISYTTGKSI